MANPAVWLMRGYPFDMGEPEQVYQQTGLSRMKMILRLSTWLLLALPVGYFAVRVLDYMRGDLAGSGQGFLILIILMAAVVWLLVPLLKKLRLYRREWGDMAVLCPEGLAYYHAGNWRGVRWDEIASVEASRETNMWFDSGELIILGGVETFLRGYIRHYAVVDYTGDRIRLGETLTNIDGLMNAIRQRTFPRILAKAQQVLNAGQEVAFGPIVISKAGGIYCDGKRYTWNQVSEVGVTGDTEKFLRIKPHHGHLLKDIQALIGFEEIKVPERDVPNEDVLLSLAASLMGVTRIEGKRSVCRD